MDPTPEPAPSLPAGWSAEASTLMFADVVESVRMIERDERRVAPRVHALLDRLSEIAARHGAEVRERRGDGLLLHWPGQERRASACALALAEAVEASALGRAPDDAILMRFGLHCGEPLSDGRHLYGTDVNLAARVAGLANPGEIVLTQAVRDQLVPGIDGDIEDLGERWLKHASQPVRTFRLTRPGTHAAAASLPQTGLPRPCIAVLPMRGNGFADATEGATVIDLLGENLVHALSRTDRLAVIAWTSTRPLATSGTTDPIEAARRLKADWCLSGSCTAFGGGLTVGLELLDAHTSTVAYSVRLRTHAADLMSAEPEFAAEVAHGVSQRICEEDASRLGRHPLPNLASHSILTGAIGLMHRSSRDSFLRSRDALEYLLERHPRMHGVRPWLAQWYVLKNTRGFGQEPVRDARHALEQTHRALDALPDDARARALLGFTHYHLLQDAATAESHLDQAVALNPNDPLALIFSAAFKNTRRKAESGRELALAALRVAPYDPLRDYIRGIASGCLLSCRDFAASIRLAEDSIRENAMHPYAWRVLLIASACQGDIERAQRAYRQLGLLGQTLTVAAYRARSQLTPEDLALAEGALRAAGVPEQ